MGSPTPAQLDARSGTVVLLAIVLAVVLLAFAPGVLGATADGADASSADPCTAVATEPAVVVTPPADEPTGPGDTVAVYNGSELVVHLCQPANEFRTLDADDQEWATVLDSSGEDRVRIRVVAPTNDSVGSLASPEPVPGPSLSIVDHDVESALVEGSIPVASAEQAADLRDALETYNSREAALQSQLATLASATATVENGSTPDDPVVEATMTTRMAYLAAADGLRAELYDVAASAVGGPRSAAAIQALANRSATLEGRTVDGLAAHDAALSDRQQSSTWSLRLRIVGLSVLGALIGAAAGAVVPIRRGRAARRRLAAGEWTAYSRRALLVPITVGVCLLVLALGWLALTVGGAIVEVMTP